MGKKKYQEKMNNEDKTLVNFHPELNQSGIYDNEGNLLPKSKREQYDPIPRGFVKRELFSKLTSKDLFIYFFLSSKCNPQRNTRVTNERIIEETGVPNVTIKRALAKLEFYHLINRRRYFIRPKRSMRITTLLRWDSAYKLLVKEGKIKAISSKEIVFVTPYLTKKFKKSKKKQKKGINLDTTIRLGKFSISSKKAKKSIKVDT